MSAIGRASPHAVIRNSAPRLASLRRQRAVVCQRSRMLRSALTPRSRRRRLSLNPSTTTAAPPCGTCLLHNRPCTHGLTTGLDPVVNQQHPVAVEEMIPSGSEQQISVPVVRRCASREPWIAIRRGYGVLTNLNQRNARIKSSRNSAAASGCARGPLSFAPMTEVCQLSARSVATERASQSHQSDPSPSPAPFSRVQPPERRTVVDESSS